MNKKIILLLFVSLIVAVNATALALTIQPAQDSTTTINPTACSQQTALLEFQITNNGIYGALCYYYSSEDGTKKPLNSQCIGKNQTKTANAFFTPPADGSKTVTFYLECYDFGGIFSGDTCTDGKSYEQAKTNYFSCGNKDGNPCAVTLAPRFATLTCIRPNISVAPNKNSISLINKQSETVQITVQNNSSGAVNCSYVSKGQTQSIGVVSGGGSQTAAVTFTAPASGSATDSQSITFTCTNPNNGLQDTESTTIMVEHHPHPSEAAISSAQSKINDASAEIQDAQTKVQQASATACVNPNTISNAQANIEQAVSLNDSAKADIASAQSSFNSGAYDSALSQANNAESEATQAKAMATSAVTVANNAISEVAQLTKDVQDTIDNTKSAIASAEAEIERANSKAVEYKVDTSFAVATLQQAKSDIGTAKSYYSQATTSLDAKNCSVAKQNADSALRYANSAESGAKAAALTFENYSQTTGAATRELENANTEISNADQVYIKLTSIMRDVRLYVDVSQTLASIDKEKENIDAAKDSYSGAQNSSSAGDTKTAITKATEARNLAASAKNQLDRILENNRYVIEDAVSKAISDAETKIKDAEDTIQKAGNSFQATQEKITDAQNKLKDAKLKLEEAKTGFANAKKQTTLDSFLTSAVSTVGTVNATNDLSKSAQDLANSAMTDIYVKAGAVAVTAAGAGGGLLYWKRRKQRKGQPGQKEGIVGKLFKKHPDEKKWQEKGKGEGKEAAKEELPAKIEKLKHEITETSKKITENEQKFLDKKIPKAKHDNEKTKLEKKKEELFEQLGKIEGTK